MPHALFSKLIFEVATVFFMVLVLQPRYRINTRVQLQSLEGARPGMEQAVPPLLQLSAEISIAGGAFSSASALTRRCMLASSL